MVCVCVCVRACVRKRDRVRGNGKGISYMPTYRHIFYFKGLTNHRMLGSGRGG